MFIFVNLGPLCSIPASGIQLFKHLSLNKAEIHSKDVFLNYVFFLLLAFTFEDQLKMLNCSQFSLESCHKKPIRINFASYLSHPEVDSWTDVDLSDQPANTQVSTDRSVWSYMIPGLKPWQCVWKCSVVRCWWKFFFVVEVISLKRAIGTCTVSLKTFCCSSKQLPQL